MSIGPAEDGSLPHRKGPRRLRRVFTSFHAVLVAVVVSSTKGSTERMSSMASTTQRRALFGSARGSVQPVAMSVKVRVWQNRPAADAPKWRPGRSWRNRGRCRPSRRRSGSGSVP